VTNRFTLPLTLALALATAACGGDGDIDVTIYGEDFIETGIPASATADGWALTFSRFSLELGNVRVAGGELEGGTFDLATDTGGAGQTVGTLSAAEGDHTHAAFTVSGLQVEGTATRDSDTKTFAWNVAQTIDYDACETTTHVASGETAGFEITIHADHLLYDSLVAASPGLRFQALADTDDPADGTITQAELAAADIGTYDPGSDGSIDDLWSWILEQAVTLGHVDGEGHCHATRR
jgi:hypothetical protein